MTDHTSSNGGLAELPSVYKKWRGSALGRTTDTLERELILDLFVDDPAPVFGEIERVLRPGCRVVIGELGKWSSWAAGRRIRGWLGSRLWRQAGFRTARELRAFAGEAGLTVTALRGAVYYRRCELAARLLKPYDHMFSRLTTVGAAFVALSATKPSA